MPNRLTAIALLLCLLTACRNPDGTYYPGCIAYEGSKIRLDNGRYLWEKFSDQVVVDDAGNVINQFPEYPKRGRYRIDGQRLTLSSDSGESDVILHIHQRDGGYLLLTDSEMLRWKQTGRYDDCVLTRQRDAAN